MHQDCFDEFDYKEKRFYSFMNNLLGTGGGSNEQLTSPLQPVSIDSYVCGTRGYIIYMCRNKNVVICCLNTRKALLCEPLAEIKPPIDILELSDNGTDVEDDYNNND